MFDFYSDYHCAYQSSLAVVAEVKVHLVSLTGWGLIFLSWLDYLFLVYLIVDSLLIHFLFLYRSLMGLFFDDLIVCACICLLFYHIFIGFVWTCSLVFIVLALNLIAFYLFVLFALNLLNFADCLFFLHVHACQ